MQKYPNNQYVDVTIDNGRGNMWRTGDQARIKIDSLQVNFDLSEATWWDGFIAKLERNWALVLNYLSSLFQESQDQSQVLYTTEQNTIRRKTLLSNELMDLKNVIEQFSGPKDAYSFFGNLLKTLGVSETSLNNMGFFTNQQKLQAAQYLEAVYQMNIDISVIPSTATCHINDELREKILEQTPLNKFYKQLSQAEIQLYANEISKKNQVEEIHIQPATINTVIQRNKADLSQSVINAPSPTVNHHSTKAPAPTKGGVTHAVDGAARTIQGFFHHQTHAQPPAAVHTPRP